MKARILENSEGVYLCQYKKWWCPWWSTYKSLEPDDVGHRSSYHVLTFHSQEEAEEFLYSRYEEKRKEPKTKVVYKTEI
jgi:hypothetical protein